jgi:glutamyl-tRNA reductase
LDWAEGKRRAPDSPRTISRPNVAPRRKDHHKNDVVVSCNGNDECIVEDYTCENARTQKKKTFLDL